MAMFLLLDAQYITTITFRRPILVCVTSNRRRLKPFREICFVVGQRLCTAELFCGVPKVAFGPNRKSAPFVFDLAVPRPMH